MTTHAMSAHAAAPHDEEEGLSRGMFGMVLFIASEVMLFGGLFAGYFFMRQQATEWPPAGVEVLNANKGAILTVILVISGFVGHFGIVAAKQGNRAMFIAGVGGAIVLGTIFIIGQGIEWFGLMHDGLTAAAGCHLLSECPKGAVYGGSFYILSGFHGAHVIVGLLMLLVVFVRATWGDFTPSRHVFADAAMLYWHFVDVVWVGLFLILYVWKGAI